MEHTLIIFRPQANSINRYFMPSFGEIENMPYSSSGMTSGSNTVATRGMTLTTSTVRASTSAGTLTTEMAGYGAAFDIQPEYAEIAIIVKVIT